MTGEDDLPPEGQPPPPTAPTNQVGDITGGVRTLLNESRGPVHAGTGHQYAGTGHQYGIQGNIQGNVQVHIHEALLRRSVRISIVAEQIEQLQKCFVEPAGFGKASALLERPGSAVLLNGPTGSGRQATAQMLLCPKGVPPSSLRMLPARTTAEDDHFALPDGSIAGERLLLDLSDLDSAEFAEQQVWIRTCVSVAAEAKASLVVVLPDSGLRYLVDDLASRLVTISKPDPRRVLQAHLLAMDVTTGSVELPAELAAASMSRLAQFARFIREARDVSPQAGLRDWINAALPGIRDHQDDLDAMWERCTSAPLRALLLSTALLENASSDSIFQAQQSLLRLIGYQPDAVTPIERDGVIDQFRALGSDVVLTGERRARFKRIAMAEPVVSHFWDSYPDLRDGFAEWVGSLAGRVDSTVEWTATLQRVTRSAARTGSVHGLFGVIEHWAKQPYEGIRSLAQLLLIQCMEDVHSAEQARRQLYLWSTNVRLDPSLAKLVIAVSSGMLISQYPSQALVRLTWLCRHGEAATARTAHQSVVSVCEDDRILRWFVQVLMNRERFDGELLRDVASPSRTTRSTGARPAPIRDRRFTVVLVDSWRRALNLLTPEARMRAFIPWLDQHVLLRTSGHSREAESLVAVLLALCADDPPSLAALYGANRSWFAAAPADLRTTRQPTAAQVERHLLHLVTAPEPEAPNSEGDAPHEPPA